MGYALSYYDTVTFLINIVCILSFILFFPPEFKLLLKSGKIISYSSVVLKTMWIFGNEYALAEIHFLCACIALVFKMCQ
jgi:thiosulfate reductase cytochrome b subunit